MTKNKFAVKRGALASEKADEREKKIVSPEEETRNSERDRYFAEMLEFHAERALAKEELPVSFAKILCGETEEETAENIAVFKQEFTKAIEAALSEKLKGRTPKTASAQVDFDPFLNGFGM